MIWITIAKALGCYCVLMSLITFIMYGIDKRKAIKKKWRVQEKTLLLWALAGGSVGALLGMLVFHHKVRKAKFFLGVPFFLLLHCGIFFLLLRAGGFFL